MSYLKIIGLFFIFIGSVGFCSDQICNKSAIQISEEIVVAQKIQLFMYEHCFYCVKVIDFLKQHNLMNEVELIDVGLPENREILRSISGRTQAPYLVDLDSHIKMPESLDIIAYFTKKFKVGITPLGDTVLPSIKSDKINKYDSSTFISFVKESKKPVVVLISTTWCPPCKVFKPIFLSIAEQFAGECEFICIDGDADRAIADKIGVECYPSIVCYKDGKKINPENYRSQVGLSNLINQLIG